MIDMDETYESLESPDHPDDGDEVTERVEERGRRRWPIVMVALVVVAAAVAGVVWGVNQRRDVNDLQARVDRQKDAVLVASGFVEALMSYDHENLDAQQTAVERFATDKFRKEYADAFTGDVRDQIVTEAATSSVTVEDVYVNVDDGDELTAIVHARSKVTSGGGATADLESYLSVRLVRLHDQWKVDDLVSLGTRDLSPPIEQPGAGSDQGAGSGG